VINNNVIHPNHYNIPGRKECIEEIIDVLGWEKTESFCEGNTYKYNYRHEQKNGQEDLDKARNYQKIRSDIISRDPRFKIANHYGLEAQLQQLIEEMAELTQAVCKHRRINGEGQPVSPDLKSYDVAENLIEEIADVKLVLEQVIFLMEIDEDVKEWMDRKIERTLERIGEQNAGN
jgi:hypothetical protein